MPAGADSYPGVLKELNISSPEKDFPVRKVITWTPDVSADQIDNLPIVYFLHGWPGTPVSMMSATVNALATSFDNGTAPFIAVFPDGNAKTHIDSEWADSADKKAMIETWLTKNVIQTVEAGNIRSRSNRAIAGFSMGGYGAAIIGLHHPELFSQVVTLAGYFVIDDLTNAYGIKPNNSNKIKYQDPSNFLNKANKIRWFLAESNQEYTTLIRGQADQWAKKLKTVKAKYVTSKLPGGHSYAFVTSEMAPVTTWFAWGKN